VRYWKVYWHHDFSKEPIAIYSEIGGDGYESRRVEEFRGGRSGWADSHGQAGGVSLADIPFGDIDEVANQPEFTPFIITRTEFEGAWERAVQDM
jgi:hypothetical protein